MRVDMGILQLETTGRPDGNLFQEHESVLEYLKAQHLEDPTHELTEDECNEVDREFIQYYHRRICWLKLQEYGKAVKDAEPLGRDIVHSVVNPVDRLTGAIHLYGGDFFEVDRLEWDPETHRERPYDFESTRRNFERSNLLLTTS